MAGDWIKMRGNLWDDPRVSKLCDLCDCGEAQVVGGLYWLWSTADQHTEDGIMPGLTLRQLDRKTGIQGFGEALCAIGWLADHPEGVRIVNFEEHNGASAKKRAVTAKRVANHRAGNADETQHDDASNSHVTQQALQNEHKSVSRALAREREEKEKSNNPPTPQGGMTRFEDFWSAWPKSERKQDKVKCAQKWRRSNLDQLADQILADIAVKRQTQKWQDGYVEAPLVYLNGKRWEDGVTPAGDMHETPNAFVGAI